MTDGRRSRENLCIQARQEFRDIGYHYHSPNAPVQCQKLDFLNLKLPKSSSTVKEKSWAVLYAEIIAITLNLDFVMNGCVAGAGWRTGTFVKQVSPSQKCWNWN